MPRTEVERQRAKLVGMFGPAAQSVAFPLGATEDEHEQDDDPSATPHPTT